METTRVSALGWLVLQSAACGGGASQLPPPACDVLLISLDTVRADVLTFRDPELTPNLCALARRGVVFDQAIAGSSWTLPSHVEIFTGLPPALHGVHDDGQRIDPRHATLGELANARGFHTVGIWSGWYLAGAYGFDRGFDRWESALAPHLEADRRLEAALREGGQAAFWAGDLRAAESHRDVSSARVVERARAILAGSPPGEPLLLFTHFFDPHHDFIPPPPFDTRFDPDYEGDLDGRDFWSNPRIYDPRRDPPRVVGERDLEHLLALYRGEVAWCDDRIGALLDTLRETGRLGRTLVIVTADHGEEFFEHAGRGHRQTLYDEVLRVPLLVVAPGGEAGTGGEEADPARRGTHIADQVSLADLLPTILDYAGGGASELLWGRSLRPLIEGRALEPRPVLATLGQVTRGPAGPRLRLLEALRTPTGKLIRRVLLTPEGSAHGVEDVEWFALGTDPGESRDPQADELDRVREAWTRMENHQARLRAFARRLPHSPGRARGTGVRSVFARELDALGYGGEGEGAGPRLPGVAWPIAPLEPLELPLGSVRGLGEGD